MRSSDSLDAIDVTFDDERLVSDAGLMLPATLAQHLGCGSCSTITSTSVRLPATPTSATRP